MVVGGGTYPAYFSFRINHKGLDSIRLLLHTSVRRFIGTIRQILWIVRAVLKTVDASELQKVN